MINLIFVDSGNYLKTFKNLTQKYEYKGTK